MDSESSDRRASSRLPLSIRKLLPQRADANHDGGEFPSESTAGEMEKTTSDLGDAPLVDSSRRLEPEVITLIPSIDLPEDYAGKTIDSGKPPVSMTYLTVDSNLGSGPLDMEDRKVRRRRARGSKRRKIRSSASPGRTSHTTGDSSAYLLPAYASSKRSQRSSRTRRDWPDNDPAEVPIPMGTRALSYFVRAHRNVSRRIRDSWEMSGGGSVSGKLDAESATPGLSVGESSQSLRSSPRHVTAIRELDLIPTQQSGLLPVVEAEVTSASRRRPTRRQSSKTSGSRDTGRESDDTVRVLSPRSRKPHSRDSKHSGNDSSSRVLVDSRGTASPMLALESDSSSSRARSPRRFRRTSPRRSPSSTPRRYGSKHSSDSPALPPLSSRPIREGVGGGLRQSPRSLRESPRALRESPRHLIPSSLDDQLVDLERSPRSKERRWKRKG